MALPKKTGTIAGTTDAAVNFAKISSYCRWREKRLGCRNPEVEQ
jgi:hypothetical protein